MEVPGKLSYIMEWIFFVIKVLIATNFITFMLHKWFFYFILFSFFLFFRHLFELSWSCCSYWLWLNFLFIIVIIWRLFSLCISTISFIISIIIVLSFTLIFLIIFFFITFILLFFFLVFSLQKIHRFLLLFTPIRCFTCIVLSIYKWYCNIKVFNYT